MTAVVQNVLRQPGDVRLEKILLISTNFYVNLEDYLVELNIYESIFSNTMSGDIVISDSRNLITNAPIIGAEYLMIEIATPSLDMKSESAIVKTFRITSVEDRNIVRDQNTQVYKLKFVSQEAVIDSLQPLYYAFSGDIATIVSKIYKENIATSRTYKLDNNGKLSIDTKKAELEILSETANKVKFVSPGWTPFDCINWLTKKSIPKSGKACNFLFWETTKGFYFGSTETLFKINWLVPGKYNYAATGVRGLTRGGGTSTIEDKMLLIQDLKILNGLDHLENLENGYFANQLIEVDVIKKKINPIEYIHTNKFKDYSHAETTNPAPLYDKNVIVNSHTHKRVYTKHPGIHADASNNYSERMGEIYGNRKSNLMDLNSLRLNITIYGRTDVQVGRTIYIKFPEIGPVSETDKAKSHLDEKFTGNYLITSMRHKISKSKHLMALEVVRDSQPTSKKDKL